MKTAFVAAAGISAVMACSQPSGQLAANPVYLPSSTDYPTLGQAYTITWDPTGLSPNVDIVLLKGPSNNVVPIATLASATQNSGSYSWTPDCSLEATDAALGYGLQVVDSVSCQFQYSMQFGLKPGQCNSPSSSSTPPASSSSAPPKSSVSKPPSSLVTYTQPPPKSVLPTGGATKITNQTTTYIAPPPTQTAGPQPTGSYKSGAATSFALSAGGLVAAIAVAVMWL